MTSQLSETEITSEFSSDKDKLNQILNRWVDLGTRARMNPDVLRASQEKHSNTLNQLPREVLSILKPTTNTYVDRSEGSELVREASLNKHTPDEALEYRAAKNLHTVLTLVESGSISVTEGDTHTTLSLNTKAKDQMTIDNERSAFDGLVPSAFNSGGTAHEVAGKTYITLSKVK